MTSMAAVPAPETDRIVVITPKGEAARAAYRLLVLLRDLGADDRTAVLAMLQLELAEPPA